MQRMRRLRGCIVIRFACITGVQVKHSSEAGSAECSQLDQEQARPQGPCTRHGDAAANPSKGGTISGSVGGHSTDLQLPERSGPHQLRRQLELEAREEQGQGGGGVHFGQMLQAAKGRR
jgi:hypothetical protein